MLIGLALTWSQYLKRLDITKITFRCLKTVIFAHIELNLFEKTLDKLGVLRIHLLDTSHIMRISIIRPN